MQCLMATTTAGIGSANAPRNQDHRARLRYCANAYSTKAHMPYQSADQKKAFMHRLHIRHSPGEVQMSPRSSHV